MELKLFYKLKEAYEVSTRNWNAFKEEIDKIKWTNIFEADGEIYFANDLITITVENINPFEEAWKPTAFLKDGSVISF